MTTPLTPFDSILARLTQGMSAAGYAKAVNDVGRQADATHTNADRLVWILTGIRAEPHPFRLPRQVNPKRQACQFEVSIYASSLDRLLGLHGLLVGWLDLIVGPEMGCPPSDDSEPAVLTGVVDLAALSYPYGGLAGKTIDVAVPGARALAFPAGTLADPQAIANAVTAAALATSGPTAAIRGRLARDGAEVYLELLLPTDTLGTTGATLTIDPTPPNSACALLGFGVADDNIADTGTPPTRPYRPGYLVEETIAPGVRGDDLAASGMGAIVPVTLYLPIASLEYLVGVIASTELGVLATGGDEPDDIIAEITTT